MLQRIVDEVVKELNEECMLQEHRSYHSQNAMLNNTVRMLRGECRGGLSRKRGYYSIVHGKGSQYLSLAIPEWLKYRLQLLYRGNSELGNRMGYGRVVRGLVVLGSWMDLKGVVPQQSIGLDINVPLLGDPSGISYEVHPGKASISLAPAVSVSVSADEDTPDLAREMVPVQPFAPFVRGVGFYYPAHYTDGEVEVIDEVARELGCHRCVAMRTCIMAALDIPGWRSGVITADAVNQWKSPTVDWIRIMLALVGMSHVVDWYDFAAHMWYVFYKRKLNFEEYSHVTSCILGKGGIWAPSRFKNGFERLLTEHTYNLEWTPKGRLYVRKREQRAREQLANAGNTENNGSTDSAA